MKLFTHTWGSPSHPPVLLLHGFLGDGSDWEAVARPLAGRYQLVAVDLPGHGRSDAPIEKAFLAEGQREGARRFLRAMDAVLAVRKGPWKAIVGYSMGGRLAMELCRRMPKRFHGLVLESASTGIPDRGERARRLQADVRLAKDLLRMPYEAFLRRWYAQPLFGKIRGLDALIAERVAQAGAYAASARPGSRRAAVKPAARLASALCWLSVGHQADLRPWMAASWRAPLLCIAGKEDPKYLEAMSGLAAQVPGARFHAAKACGHNVHRHDPEAYVALLSDFLAGY